jgi:hypothetical protein
MSQSHKVAISMIGVYRPILVYLSCKCFFLFFYWTLSTANTILCRSDINLISRELVQAPELSASSHASTLLALDHFYTQQSQQQRLLDDAMFRMSYTATDMAAMVSPMSHASLSPTSALSSNPHGVDPSDKNIGWWTAGNDIGSFGQDAVESMRAATAESVTRTARLVEEVLEDRVKRRLTNDKGLGVLV